ncbi:MAG TPA: glycosyltransferase [Candidatus Ruthenibacterium merdavium]|uniref:Glycosyltransferase n=1 Tax=Candidatus Ruthenibacterium merdavium TaxID=2838752 RepID=A0A9D2TIS1_9FIRM|nr:glycosyltransferase [Candidatus Ruthenibacterium merdavium]
MNNSPLITVYTQVYNTKESDLRTCIESVLNQTYQNIEYFILDNGSTDGSFAILEEYAKKDSRIHLFRFEKNIIRFRYTEISQSAQGQFWTMLDSDDWIDPSYIEHLLFFAMSKNLDITICGTLFHLESGETCPRALSEKLVLNSMQYNTYFPLYHVYFRAMWGKLVKSKIINQSNICTKVFYGGDTILAFNWLKLSRQIGISPELLHHYRIHSSSVSYRYDSLRFQSDLVLFQDALDFLKPYGPISAQNLTFLYSVYCNALSDTLNVIDNSDLSAHDKLEEYKKIALEPITRQAYQIKDDSAKNSKELLLFFALKICGDAENGQSCLDALCAYFTQCSKLLTVSNSKILISDVSIFQAFSADDYSALCEVLIKIFKQYPYKSQEKIADMLSCLTEKLPLCKMCAKHRFLAHFSKIFLLLFHSQNLEALEEMTDLLLNDRVKDAQETFFELYLTLAAFLQQESAYLFGKIRFAEYLFSKKRYAECAKAIAELEQMGLSKHEEVEKLKKELSRHT